jgi:hypothetical protein
MDLVNKTLDDLLPFNVLYTAQKLFLGEKLLFLRDNQAIGGYTPYTHSGSTVVIDVTREGIPIQRLYDKNN